MPETPILPKTKLVFRGPFPTALFRQLMTAWGEQQGHAKRYRSSALASLLGVPVHTISRLYQGDAASRKKGADLRPCPEIGAKLEDFFRQPRGTFGGEVDAAFPENGLKPVETPSLELEEPAVPEPTAATTVPEPAPRQSKSHTVLSVTGADLEEPSRDTVNAGWRLIPLDQLGEWGHALIKLMDPFFKQRAAGNQIPVLIEHAANFDTIVITVPVPYGERKSVVVPSALHKRLIDSCKIISGQEAVYLIADMFTAYSAAKVEEIKSQALGRAAMQDQLVVRQHIGDLETMVGDMGPLGTALRDVEHDVSVALGRDHATATELLNLVDKYDTLRQEFRSLMKLIQGRITK